MGATHQRYATAQVICWPFSTVLLLENDIEARWKHLETSWMTVPSESIGHCRTGILRELIFGMVLTPTDSRHCWSLRTYVFSWRSLVDGGT